MNFNPASLTFIVSVVVVIGIVATRPYVVIRPSFWVMLIFMLRIAAAAGFAGPEIDRGYVHAGTLRMLTVLFPFGIIAWTLLTPAFDNLAFKLSASAQEPDLTIGPPERKSLLILAVAAGLTIAVYLQSVPLMSTGLVAVFRDPANAALIRDESLKMVSSPLVRYSYTWHMKVVAPLLMGLVILWAHPRPTAGNVFRYAIVFLIILSVMLPGARGPGGQMFVVLALIFMLRKGVWRGGVALATTVVFALVIASVMTLSRQGDIADISYQRIFELFVNSIFRRAFVDPFDTGLCSNLYAYEHGLLGISNIRPLTILFGIPYVNLANLTAVQYYTYSVFNTYANTCFLFDMQASFGLYVGWFVALIAASLLDWLLYAFQYLRGMILVVFLGVFMAALTTLVGTPYTTSLFSDGILLIAMIAAMVGYYWRPTFNGRAAERP